MAVKMTIQEVVNYFLKYNTKDTVAKKLGVTPHQVYLYATGKTKSPHNRIVDNVYDNLMINGERIILDFFKDEEEYLNQRQLRRPKNES